MIRSVMRPLAAGVAAAILLGAPPALAQTAGAAQAAAPQQFVLISKIKVKPGQEAKFKQVTRDFYAAIARDEPGCLTNIMYRPAPSPPGVPGGMNAPVGQGYTFYEVYRDRASMLAHPQTPHFARFMAEAGPLMDGPAELNFVSEVARR